MSTNVMRALDDFEMFETEDGRGLGLRTKVPLIAGKVVLIYEGEKLTRDQALDREEENSILPNDNCYMFWMRYADRWIIVDASRTNHLSRYINHSKKQANLAPVCLRGRSGEMPEIAFKAKRNIEPGEELLFDYGDNRKEVVQTNPWLKK